MPPNGRTLTVYLAADTKKAQQQLSTFQKTLKTLGKVAGVAAVAGVAVMTKKLADLASESIDLASDLDEVNSKIDQIFGESTGNKLDTWAKGMADAFGISELAAKDAASNYAVFGKQAGLTGDDLADFSIDLVELAGDMASFNNTSLEQALGAIRSGLAGSSEPLLTYGVNTQIAALKTQALKDGLIEEGDALDETTKTMAIYKTLLAKTTDQQGDFARTADGLANKQKILQAKMQDLKSEIGTALLPVMTELTDMVLTVLLPAFQDFWESIDEDVMRALADFGKWLEGPGREALQGFIDGVKNDLLPALQEAAGYIGESMAIYGEFAGALNDVASALGAGGNEDGTVQWMRLLVDAVVTSSWFLPQKEQVRLLLSLLSIATSFFQDFINQTIIFCSGCIEKIITVSILFDFL